MPGMTGVDFLQQALKIYPDAKRVLLTAYADTEAAIRAINSAKIHYYLNKPWDPPEEKLYPVLDDLLETWKQGYKPPYEGLIVVGTRWSSADHTVRELLSRNSCPGSPRGVSAADLEHRAYIPAQRLGAESLAQHASAIRRDNQYQIVQTSDGREVTCHVCLIATGVAYCKLAIPGADQLTVSG